MADVPTGFEPGVVTDLLDRLEALGALVREKRRRLIVRGQPGFERDNAIQSLVARLRWEHAAHPDEVAGLVRQRHP
jgi:hypothetical protein